MKARNLIAAAVLALTTSTLALMPATSHAANPVTAVSDKTVVSVPGSITVPILANDTITPDTAVFLVARAPDGSGVLTKVVSGEGWTARITDDNQLLVETTSDLPWGMRFLQMSYVLHASSAGAGAGVIVAVDRTPSGGDTTPTEGDTVTVEDNITISTTVPGESVRLKDGLHVEGTRSYFSTGERDTTNPKPVPANASAQRIAREALGGQWLTGKRTYRRIPAGVYYWTVRWKRTETLTDADGTELRKSYPAARSVVRVRVSKAGRVTVLTDRGPRAVV